VDDRTPETVQPQSLVSGSHLGHLLAALFRELMGRQVSKSTMGPEHVQVQEAHQGAGSSLTRNCAWIVLGLVENGLEP
jgi:hypothetical protein